MAANKNNKMSKRRDIIEEIQLPKGVNAAIDKDGLFIKGPHGEIKKRFVSPKIDIYIKDDKVVISSKNVTKREKRLIGSFKSHIKNMIKGVTESYVYKLKICSGHFPMNISVSGNEFIIRNFIGEKIPRKLKIKEGAKVKVEGDNIIVESVSKETAGQVSADIEQLTRRTKYDTRIFQDGCYIIMKDSKEIK